MEEHYLKYADGCQCRKCAALDELRRNSTAIYRMREKLSLDDDGQECDKR